MDFKKKSLPVMDHYAFLAESDCFVNQPIAATVM